MSTSGKQGPPREASHPQGQNHPQGRRHEAPRLSNSEHYSNPKTRAEDVLQQSQDVDQAGKPAHRAEKGNKPRGDGTAHE